MSPKKPNILFLLTDQLRHDFLGCYGADFLKTPAIDGLAASGTRYETCISPAPICVPARASMMTGLAAHQTGVIHNLQWLRPDRRQMGVKTWPEHLNNAGYHTSAIGKMHFYPWDASEGFQHRIIAEDKRHIHIKDDYHTALQAAGFHKQHGDEMAGYQETQGACLSELPDGLQIDRWVAGQSIEKIQAHDFKQPLAMMVGFPGPHCPYDPPADALDRIDRDAMPAPVPATAESNAQRADFIAAYKRGWANLDYTELSAQNIQTIRQYYAAAVERIDADVAAILAALRQRGALDNTIVVFTSDHGDYLGDFGKVGKASFHEPSVRVPMIVTDFRTPGGSVSRQLTSLTDLFPSFLSWADIDPDPNASGQNSHGFLLGQAPQDRIIIGVTAQGMMARDAEWKLVRYQNGSEALFDLTTDPDEQTNVLGQHPAQRARLDHALARSLLQALTLGHADKLVNAVKETPPHPFYGRNWQRPYPSKMTAPKIGT